MVNDLERVWLGQLPDEVRWVDFRGLLYEGRSKVIGDEAGCVILTPDYPGGSIIGRPSLDALEAAKRWRSAHSDEPSEMIAQPEDAEYLASAFQGWRRGEAILHRLDPDLRIEAAAARHDVRMMTAKDREHLEGLPNALHVEIGNAIDRGMPVAGAYAKTDKGSQPVAFCYAALETESLWDVSVETLPEFRRQGLAEACFLAIEEAERARGRTAIWGAHDDNHASLALARRLGFVPDSRLIVFFEPSDQASDKVSEA